MMAEFLKYAIKEKYRQMHRCQPGELRQLRFDAAQLMKELRFQTRKVNFGTMK